jgi:DNA-binding NtrC family response regulator
MAFMTATRILIVDDDPATCECLAKALSREGYEVYIANGSTEALHLIAERTYALALLDYRMPEMNGDEVYRRMLTIQPDVIGVFLTGYPTLDTVFPAVDSGAARILAKPVDLNELIQVVNDCLVMS